MPVLPPVWLKPALARPRFNGTGCKGCSGRRGSSDTAPAARPCGPDGHQRSAPPGGWAVAEKNRENGNCCTPPAAVQCDDKPCNPTSSAWQPVPRNPFGPYLDGMPCRPGES